MRWVSTLTAARDTLATGRALRAWIALFFAFSLLATNGCAWLDAKQRQIIYRPTPGEPAGFAGLRVGDERYFVQVPQLDASSPAQRIEMWWLPHADKNAPTLLYFHGTFRNLPQNLGKIEALRAAGFAVLAVDYRGWGSSSSITPSEQTILQDADLAWAELVRREPRAAQRVIYGHSMGSGVAVDLASRLRARVDYGAVILESALTSFKDVAGEAGFWAGLLARFSNQYFASLGKISKVQAPVLMIHGSADNTVPISVGEKLFAAANAPKQWLPIEGGRHSDLHQAGAAQYQAALRGFADKYVLGR
jgi:uncharacterized protein